MSEGTCVDIVGFGRSEGDMRNAWCGDEAISRLSSTTALRGTNAGAGAEIDTEMGTGFNAFSTSSMLLANPLLLELD